MEVSRTIKKFKLKSQEAMLIFRRTIEELTKVNEGLNKEVDLHLKKKHEAELNISISEEIIAENLKAIKKIEDFLS